MMRKGLIQVCAITLALGSAPIAMAGPSQADIDMGKELAFSRSDGNCLACHKMDDGKLTGTIAPELANMKARFPDRDALFKRIWDETKFNPQTVMPPFGRNLMLSKDQINRIVDYLYTL